MSWLTWTALIGWIRLTVKWDWSLMRVPTVFNRTQLGAWIKDTCPACGVADVSNFGSATSTHWLQGPNVTSCHTKAHVATAPARSIGLIVSFYLLHKGDPPPLFPPPPPPLPFLPASRCCHDNSVASFARFETHVFGASLVILSDPSPEESGISMLLYAHHWVDSIEWIHQLLLINSHQSQLPGNEQSISVDSGHRLAWISRRINEDDSLIAIYSIIDTGAELMPLT